MKPYIGSRTIYRGLLLFQIKIKKDTPIWYERLQNWTTINEVEELRFLFVTEQSAIRLIKPSLTKTQ